MFMLSAPALMKVRFSKNIDGGRCRFCGRERVELGAVKGVPPMCRSCVKLLYDYPVHIDPFGLCSMPEGTVISDQLAFDILNYIVEYVDERDARAQSARRQDGFVDRAVSNKDRREELENVQAMIIGMRIAESSATNEWTEKKELMHYQNVLPKIDERDFEFDLCDNVAFSNYLKKITIPVNTAYQNDRIRAIKAFIHENPLVDVNCEAVKTKDGLTQIRLVHRAESIDAAHEKFRRIILKYRSTFPYLSDASGMVYDDKKLVIVVLRQYKVRA